MLRVLSLVLLLAIGSVTVGCHASGHVDKSGVGAAVAPNH